MTVWRIATDLPDEPIAEAMAAALGEVADAVSAFETTPAGPWQVTGFTQEKPEQATLDRAAALIVAAFGIALPAITVEGLPDSDWVTENQRSFPPICAGRYFIHGSHHAGPVPAGSIGLEIDAATAFGTGEHATTQGCLLALDALVRRHDGRRPRVLDMGTGTGILAIAAAKTWGVPVLACDIDPNSARVAGENAVANGVGHLVRTYAGDGYRARILRQAAPFDLIFANILARPLAAMAGSLARNLAPGGVAILSGLLSWQESYVRAAHRRDGLRFRRRIARDGWHTLMIEKPNL
ncbi:MAG TPA: 50S ribosomal protein L11 methyltransferase [Stellaceae bacterium]|nr:50S ribosomal protein L11 methyltransferase [Stellaceae bacterium]